MHSLSRSLFLSFISVVGSITIGCALPESSGEEEVDQNSEAVHASWKCNVFTIDTPDCQGVLAEVHAQALAVGRDWIVSRGHWWLASGVTYDRDAYEGGYRRDCSGFVSMAWEFESNPSTAYFPPFIYDTYAYELGSWDELIPGDAVNKTYRDPYGHVMLFAGWAAADHTSLYLMHHYSTGKPVALIQVSLSELGDYIPIRSINAPGAAPGEPPPPPPPPPTPPTGCGVMGPGAALGPDQGIASCDGRFTLIQQSDGNLVLYMDGKGALWSTQTEGTGGETTVMQEDGNLVVYAPGGHAVWNSQTQGNPGSWLQVQDDGNVVIYQYGALWNSKTAGY